MGTKSNSVLILFLLRFATGQELLDFGPTAQVSRLYSYPNNFNEVGFMDSSLEETIQHYLNDTFARDAGNCAIGNFRESDSRLFAELTGNDAAQYKTLIAGFLKIGEVALNAGRQVVRDDKWDYRWRLFLSHGLPMLNHHTVELMHFPPDYVLTSAQDNLAASTTRRWSEILTITGAPPAEVLKFQTIVDILPIAAPGDHGSRLSPVIDYFSNYAQAMLDHVLLRGSGQVRPLVIFGSPARTWLGELLGLTFRVGEVHVVTLPSNVTVPLTVANHPSYLYNAMAFDPEYPESEEERHAFGMTIMRADLVSGAWQVKMGLEPNTDPFEALELAEGEWLSGDMDNFICKLTWTQGFDKTEEEAEALCHDNEIYITLS